MSTYLVTGVAGFIAHRTAELLLDGGHQVVGLDNMNDAYDVRLKQWRLAQLQGRPGFEFHKVDISHLAELGRVFNHCASPIDAIINLAARAGVRQSLENPAIYFETNVKGTLNLLDLCREKGINKFVLASSSSVYGDENLLPYNENAVTDFPLSPYAASKKSAEALCYCYHYLYGIDMTVFRYFSVYGPACRPDMSLLRFVQWIIEGRPVRINGDGRQSRDFTYIDDIANGTILGLKPVGYEIINLGADKPVALMEVVRVVEKITGRKAHIQFAPRHPADVQSTWANISKAARLLDWKPTVSFPEGMSELVRWYQRERNWAREIET
jgi:nucleoside-diphosphate-sugar epimerase